MVNSWNCNLPPALAPEWALPPNQLRLPPDEVHAWLVSLDQPAACLKRLQAVLSPDELERAARFRFPHLQTRFTAGRGVLRLILGEYLACGPQAVRFQYGPQGKPALDPAFTRALKITDLSFNLAHTGAVGLFAFARGRDLGIDIEAVRPIDDLEAISRRFFAREEIAELLALPAEQHVPAFYTCWTRKEAYIKAVSLGLSLPLDSFAVCFTPGQPPALRWARLQPDQAERWDMVDLPVGEGYRAALVVEGNGWGLRMFRWGKE